MRLQTPAWLIAGTALLLSAAGALGQGTFQNLNFEQSIIVSSSPSGYGFDTGTANVPGWTEYNGWGDANYPGGTTLDYNSETLDAAGIALEGTAYWRPAIAGNYSIFLEGGSIPSSQYGTNGAAIGQTGQIPATAKSISFYGSSFYAAVTFNGQLLSFRTIGNGQNFTIYGADISTYAGQTGELLFHALWPGGGGMIDNIRFSNLPIPEPGVFGLSALAACRT
jgi:hypothetical protein